MAEISICSNCGNKLKDQWLVCQTCHQARWRRILPYYFGGAASLAIALWSLPQGEENAVLLCIGGISVLLGAVMLLIGGGATLRGLTVRKTSSPTRTTVATPAIAPMRAANAAASPGTTVLPPMVNRLGSFVGTDEQKILKIDFNIQCANREPGWDQLNIQPGQADRAKIPDHIRETIDYLLDEHKLTHDTTLARLFKLGSAKLRETIIRILGAMGTKEVLPMLEEFAAKDPLQVNEDEEYNLTSSSSSPLSVTWGMPLRNLAKEEIQRVLNG